MRTNLWVVPTCLVLLIIVLFVVTIAIDRDAVRGQISLPAWISAGSADAVRQVLIAIAASVITVAGVVFSITILVLQLASQQFGPRMLRNFIRDSGTQISLGAFVATFVYAVLVLTSVTDGNQPFVPHLSATVAVGLTLIDLGVLIYYIDHVASEIQLTAVVSGIAQDFRIVLAGMQEDAKRWQVHGNPGERLARQQLPEFGGEIASAESGFVQAIGHARLVRIATASDTVIQLLHRPGHFVVEGQPLALVAPASGVEAVARALTDATIVGHNRTLTQDPIFAIDQLVEVAIRALSPAVNDTFTALNCIDWLGDCLCRTVRQPFPSGVYYDAAGNVRLIEPVLTAERLIKGATDKIRQAGRGMPAVLIRQLENLEKVTESARTPGQREILLHHADLILRTSEESVPEEADRRDVRRAYDAVVAATQRSWDG
jgi:uncharacterized membrane protein